MYDLATLERTMRLHDRSYGLFTWLNDALKQKKLPYAHIEPVLTSKPAAEAWIQANFDNLPADLRPSAEERPSFAFHFVSYINTSFEMVDTRMLPRCPGCTCCGYTRTAARHMKVRSLGSHAKEKALELKKIYLQKLGEETGRALSPAEAERFIADHPDLSDAVTLATYTQELIRRGNATSQGEAVLSLWRELSEELRTAPRHWSGKKKRYKLTASGILEAEKQILAELK